MQDETLYHQLEQLAQKEQQEFFAISAVTRKGVAELMARVSELLKELPKEEFVPMEERKIYTLEEEKKDLKLPNKQIYL